MSASRTKRTEDEWLCLKAAIRRLYLIDDVPLKELVGRVGELGLVVTKAQLEYQLKKWKFNKKMDKSAAGTLAGRLHSSNPGDAFGN